MRKVDSGQLTVLLRSASFRSIIMVVGLEGKEDKSEWGKPRKDWSHGFTTAITFRLHARNELS